MVVLVVGLEPLALKTSLISSAFFKKLTLISQVGRKQLGVVEGESGYVIVHFACENCSSGSQERVVLEGGGRGEACVIAQLLQQLLPRVADVTAILLVLPQLEPWRT